MGLSVISTTNASVNLAASPVAGVLADGMPGDFASLLSGQTLAALMSQPGIGNASGSDPKETGRSDAPNEGAENGGILAMDPAALVAMLGNAQLQPESTPRADSLTERPENASQTGISLTTNALLGNRAEAETVAATKWNPAASERATRALPEPGGEHATKALPEPGSEHATKAIPEPGSERPVLGASPEKAAILAAEHPAPPSEAASFATGLTAASLQRGISTDAQTVATKPAHTETWPQQFSEKIVWMAKNDQQTAQINISPPQLGPVQITLNLNGDNANVLFASPHPEVRQIIESSLPQLREMLAATGISLGESSVGANMAQQNQNNPFTTANKNQSPPENAILPANDAVPTTSSGQVPKAGRGLVDLFA
jgi:flagellar hook-length control protein FliK